MFSFFILYLLSPLVAGPEGGSLRWKNWIKSTQLRLILFLQNRTNFIQLQLGFLKKNCHQEFLSKIVSLTMKIAHDYQPCTYYQGWAFVSLFALARHWFSGAFATCTNAAARIVRDILLHVILRILWIKITKNKFKLCMRKTYFRTLYLQTVLKLRTKCQWSPWLHGPAVVDYVDMVSAQSSTTRTRCWQKCWFCGQISMTNLEASH